MMFTKSIVFLTLASVCLSSPVPRQPENDGIAEKSQNLQRDSGIDSLGLRGLNSNKHKDDEENSKKHPISGQNNNGEDDDKDEDKAGDKVGDNDEDKDGDKDGENNYEDEEEDNNDMKENRPHIPENPDLVADFLKNTGSFIEENKVNKKNKVKKKGNKGGKKGIKGKKSVPKNRKNIHKRNHGLGKGKKIGFSTESEDFLIQQAVTDAFANIFDSIISLLNNHKKDSDIDDQENNDIDD
ncbi:hypothetical protein BB558_007430 [Smittium angustum]|uniref:Uncharacterized protein n=1 Tax=Smittium angustum TaxID=133377 RepID=A0A2U1IV14_SMIAN|nr:hypothetical protein BB558_007430 [Smittium angustum]